MKTVTINKFIISFIVFIVLALINAVICQSAFDVDVFEVFYSGGKTGQTVTDSHIQTSGRPTSTISTWVTEENTQNGESGEYSVPRDTEANLVSNTQAQENEVPLEDKKSDSDSIPENFSSEQAVQIASPPQSRIFNKVKNCEVDIIYPAPFSVFLNGKHMVTLPEVQETLVSADAPASSVPLRNRVVYPARISSEDSRTATGRSAKNIPTSESLPDSAVSVATNSEDSRKPAVVTEPAVLEDYETIVPLHEAEGVSIAESAPAEAAPKTTVSAEFPEFPEFPELPEVPNPPNGEESVSESYYVAKPDLNAEAGDRAGAASSAPFDELEPLKSPELVEVQPAPHFGLPDPVEIAKYGPPAVIPDCPEDGFVELEVSESEYVPTEERIWPDAPRKMEMYDFPKVEN